MGSKALNLLKFFIGWPLSLAAIYFIFKLISPKTSLIVSKFNQVNILFLFISIMCFIGYFFVRSYLWKEILKTKGYNISFKDNAYLWELSEIKRYIPGNIWAFLARSVLFAEKGVPKKSIASSLLIELQFFIVSASIIASFSLSYFFSPLLTFINQKELVINFFALLVILGSFIYLISSLWSLRLRKSKNILIKSLAYFFPTFSIFTNLKLILIGLFYMLLFCFGTYFAVYSVFTLPLNLTLIIISFFSLSFLIGFLSLVTPTGLGVRELIMTFGLSNLITMPIAGFAAIFSRVVLIFSEIVFFVLLVVWQNLTAAFFKKILSFAKSHTYEIILVFFTILYISYFTFTSFLRYENFYAGRFDLGNMDQTVWNTINGKVFEFTNPDGTEIVSRLAFHADFILILLSPLYLIWQDPRMLLLIQAVIVAFGSIFVYLIAEKIIKNKILSLVFSLSYLLNPSVEYANLYDFHAVTLTTTFLLAAFYFVLKQKTLIFLIFIILAALTKEQVWLIIAIFGIYIFLRKYKPVLKLNKTQLLGMGIFLSSILIFLFLVFYAIPKAGRGNHFAFSYYQKLGASPKEISLNILTNPGKTTQILLKKEKLDYLFKLFFPLGFLSLVSPQYLIFALPDFSINLLSQKDNLYQIYYHYTTTITPFIFISSIYGVNQLKKKFPNLSLNIFSLYIILTTLVSAYFFGPLPFSKSPNTDMIFKPLKNKDKINEIISKIPKKNKVVSTNNLGAHLSQRDYLYTLPIGLDQADSILFLHGDFTTGLSFEDEKKMVEKISNNKNYKLVYKQDNFVFFERINPNSY